MFVNKETTYLLTYLLTYKGARGNYTEQSGTKQFSKVT